MNRVFKFISVIFKMVSAGFLFAIVIVVVLQVFFRYVAHIVVPWTEEAARYLCIWMVFTGAVYAVAHDNHLKISFFQDKAAPKLKKLLVLFSYFVMALFSLIILLGSIHLIQQNWKQLAVTFPLSIAVLYVPLTIFATISLPLLVYLFAARIASPKNGRNSDLESDRGLRE